MSVYSSTTYKMWCNGIAEFDGKPMTCFASFTVPEDYAGKVTPAVLRKLAAEAGWTHVPFRPPWAKRADPSLSQDLCPEHKPQEG